MGIDFRNPLPLYEQIENDIKSKIANGELNVGDKISSQSQSANEYKVSLITIKKALSNLINEGILYSRVGKGSYVARKAKVVDMSKHKSIGLVLRDCINICPMLNWHISGVRSGFFKSIAAFILSLGSIIYSYLKYLKTYYK